MIRDTRHFETYQGFFMGQREGVMKVFDKFLKYNMFDKVIEIGTGRGGFALYLSDTLTSTFHTMDIADTVPDVLKQIIKDNGSHIYTEDCFATLTVKDLTGYGRTLLLCDGGNKIEEVAVFSKYLKSGDMIMAHDFAVDRDTHKLLDLWKACEIMAEHMDLDGLERVKRWSDLFEKVVWGLRSVK